MVSQSPNTLNCRVPLALQPTILCSNQTIFSHIQSKRSLPRLTLTKVVVKFSANGTSVSNVLFIVISLIECNGFNESRDIYFNGMFDKTRVLILLKPSKSRCSMVSIVFKDRSMVSRRGIVASAAGTRSRELLRNVNSQRELRPSTELSLKKSIGLSSILNLTNFVRYLRTLGNTVNESPFNERVVNFE